MKIFINGTEREVASDFTAQQLIKELGLTGRRVAMEVNKEIVPRSRYAEHPFQANDQIEIVHAIGGG